jgi:hypothetical protein
MPGISNILLARSGAAAVTYATWDSTKLGSGTTLSNSDRNAVSLNNTSDLATGGKSTGKWYMEMTRTGTGSCLIGVANTSSSRANFPGENANSWAVYSVNGNKFTGGSGSAYGTSFASGDIVMVALDMDNGKVWMGKTGTWYNSGDPEAGTNAAFTGLTGTLMIIGGGDAATSRTLSGNWGQAAFSHTIPPGFSAWTV